MINTDLKLYTLLCLFFLTSCSVNCKFLSLFLPHFFLFFLLIFYSVFVKENQMELQHATH